MRLRNEYADLTDDERDARAPRRWMIWRVAVANLVALIAVVVAFVVVGGLVVYNGHQDDRREGNAVKQAERDQAARREQACGGNLVVGPTALAIAFGQDESSPALASYRLTLLKGYPYCAEFGYLNLDGTLTERGRSLIEAVRAP